MPNPNAPTASQPIASPAGFVTPHVLELANGDGTASAVGVANPIPVAQSPAAARSAMLAGTASGSAVAGPFAPDLARSIWVTLSGSWSGTVSLLRSVDGGATRLPLTYIDGTARAVWTAPVNAAVAEESQAGATYYVSVALSSGTVAYRVTQ